MITREQMKSPSVSASFQSFSMFLLFMELLVLCGSCPKIVQRFLRVTWRVDFTGDLAMLEEDLSAPLTCYLNSQ